MTARCGLSLLEEQGCLLEEALGSLAFKRVFSLVARIQVARKEAVGAGFVMELTAQELATCLEALGELPYARVHALIASLRHQLIEDLDAEGGALR